MKDQELINFVNWLMKNQESPKGSSFEETVSWINDLSASDEGRQMLNQLINTYKESHMNNLFKEGGKLQHLLCLKSGGKGPGCGCKKAEDGTIMPDAQPVLGGQPISKSPVLSQNKYSGKAGDYTFSTNSLHKPVTGDWYQEINTGKGVLGRTYSNGQWNYTKDGNPIGENINLDRLGQIFDSNRTKFLDSRYYEGYTDKTKHIDAYAPGGVMDGDEVAGGKVDGMGLPIQTPKRRKDIVWTNIISNGNTGKAATWITPNGRNQRTEYLMGDNNPDVPGFANDIRVDVKRDPQTGELRQDSVVVNKIAPGIWLPFGLPIKYSADAETVRNAKRRHQTGGVLFAKDGATVDDEAKYQKARGYYAKHSDSDTIKKIQQFLIGKGYYGDFNEALGVEDDGKFGRKTYNAIVKYQQDNSLVDDGMWGEDTNSMARLLNAVNAPYRNDSSGSSGAHSGWLGSGKYTNPNIPKFKSKEAFQSAISEVEANAISNPEWFWGDSEDAAGWRQLLQQKWKNPEEAAGMKAILDNIYFSTPREIKNKIDAKKLPQHIQQARMNAGITDATGKVADFVATKALPAIALPLSAVAAPLATVGGLAGGALGSVVGGNTWRNLHEGDNANYEVTDELGNTAIVVRDPDQYYYDQGALVGGTLGGVFGSMVPGAIKYGTEHLYGARTRPSRVSDHKGPHGYRGGDGKFTHADNEGWFDGGNIFDFSRGLLFKKGGKL